MQFVRGIAYHSMKISALETTNYPDFLHLYNQAFPPEERRKYRDEQHLSLFIKEKEGKFHALAACDGEHFLGFLTYWTFKDFIYIEHFAVEPQHRGKKIGSLMLRHIVCSICPDVLIEVEHPNTPEACNRLRFYERNGFRTREEIEYIQPPYSPELGEVRLLLMTHGEVNIDNINCIKEMQLEVYGATLFG